MSAFGNACESEMHAAVEDMKGSNAIKRGAAENALRRMLGLPQKFRDVSHLKPKGKRSTG